MPRAETDSAAIVVLMRTLSGLCNPRERNDQTCVLALSLINIALEAGGGELPPLIRSFVLFAFPITR